MVSQIVRVAEGGRTTRASSLGSCCNVGPEDVLLGFLAVSAALSGGKYVSFIGGLP